MKPIKFSNREFERMQQKVQGGRERLAYVISCMTDVMSWISENYGDGDGKVVPKTYLPIKRLADGVIALERLEFGLNSHRIEVPKVGEPVSRWVAKTRNALIEDHQSYVLLGGDVNDVKRLIQDILEGHDFEQYLGL